MYLLSEFKKKEEDNKLKKVAYGTGSVVVGQQAIRSGVPRVLGVRLESHSTSKSKAKEILKNGGYLDPNKGGTGASRLAENWADDAKGRVYVTGKHKNYRLSEIGQTEKLPKILDNPIFDRLQAKIQRSAYRGQAGASKLSIKDAMLGATGFKGKTLYTGGSDQTFNTKFKPAPDDYALISNDKVKVYGSRLSATTAAIKREGLVNLMKANKGRVGAGIAILGGGLTVSGVLASKALGSNGTQKKKKRPKFLNGYRK